MNFNEQNPLSVSSLSAAVKLNELNVLRDLVNKGRNVNITDNRGWTPLHEAAALNHTECMEILLKAGARVRGRTHQGETPLFLACENNALESVKIMLKWDSCGINISNNESVTPLHISCSKHCVEIAKLLIDNHALINAEDNSGITPLHEAILSKDVELCKLLIESGVNLNSREYDGNLAFHFACMVGNIEITKLLLTRHEDNMKSVINDVNCDGFTPLMLAVQGCCVELVNELLLRGANPDIVNSDKTLALHLAVHTGNLDLLKIIYNATSKKAINKFCTVTIDELENCFGDVTYPTKSLVCLAIDSESLECLDFILHCGLSCDVLNCPIIVLPVQIQRFSDTHRYLSVSDIVEEEQIYNINNRIIIHPITFLLHEKLPDLKADSVKFLKLMLENGLFFDCFNYKTDLIVFHPLEAAMFRISSYGEKFKDAVIDCFSLMFEHGVSPDYVSSFSSHDSIPALLVYACKLGFVEIIPHLLKHSNVVEIDDLLKWFVKYIFARVLPVNSVSDSLVEVYRYLKHYSSLPNLNAFKKPELEGRFNELFCRYNCDGDNSVPCLKTICRTVIRRTVRKGCMSSHQFRIKLNSLELPSSVLSFLNYGDLSMRL